MKANFYTPVVTAFLENGRPDHTANRAIYEHLIQGGVNGILLLGSIGEFFAVSPEDQKEMVRVAVEQIAHRIKLIVGTSSMDVKECIALSNSALEQGADAVMALPPYYFGMSDASIEHFFDLVAEGCRGDLYLYNFPERTGYPVPPQVVLNLVRKHKNIVGIKDSAGSFSSTREYLRAVLPEFPNFQVFSGFDDNFVHNLAAGGVGCIGGLSNLVPELCSQWIEAANTGDWAGLSCIQQKMDRLMDLYTVSKPFIPAMKKAMILRGIPLKDISSEPFLPVDDAQTEAIRIILKDTGLLAE